MSLFHNFTKLIKLSSVNLCNWLCGISSVFLLSKPLVSGIVVMKIAHWSNFGFRLLMSSSLLICQRGCDWIINETQRKYTKIAPMLWSSLSCCVKNVRKRGINRWQKVLLSALFWGKSVHQEDRLILLICSPCRGTIANGSWYIRTISWSSMSCDQSKPDILQKLQHSSQIYLSPSCVLW